MAKKIALLIGVGDYGASLKSLRCPKNGVKAMRNVLQNPEIGGFDEVVSLINPGVGEMRSRICEVFAQLTKQDLILFYFTGHGLKDMTGDFFLTTAQTHLFANGRPNAGTAIEADFLKREIANSLAERKVIILDCCFGAAFAGGFIAMNSGSIDIEAQLGGKGWCLMTASTSSRYALEKTGEPLSVYTRHLVEGLSTGAAAGEGQRLITARHWHEYVKQKVKEEAATMEPAIFSGQQGYEIAIAQVKINRIQQYRQQVESKIHNGIIGPAARAILRQWQHHCQLSTAQAKEIEEAVLLPYRQARMRIAIYTKALEAEKGLSYPLKQSSVQDLQDLKQLLNLRDEDVGAEEEKILGRAVSLDRSIEQVQNQQLCTQQTIGVRSTIQLPSNQSRKTLSVQIENQVRTYLFETFQVDRYGEPLKVKKRQATAFFEDLGNGVTLEMVKIPAGTFTMGAGIAEESANEDEYPPRKASVTEFWIGKYAITQAQWQQFVASHQDSKPALTANQHNKPANSIFWTEAVECCHWLSQLSGKDYRLPSQIQWEYACRANTTTPFYFGETLTPEIANYNGNYSYSQGPKGLYRQQTTEVGSFPPNAFGLYDMHGNVWEWCLDNWHDVHQSQDKSDRVRRLSGQRKVLKGGSWFYQPTDCRSAHRLTYPFHNRSDDVGFRVVCVLLDEDELQ